MVFITWYLKKKNLNNIMETNSHQSLQETQLAYFMELFSIAPLIRHTIREFVHKSDSERRQSNKKVPRVQATAHPGTITQLLMS